MRLYFTRHLSCETFHCQNKAYVTARTPQEASRTPKTHRVKKPPKKERKSPDCMMVSWSYVKFPASWCFMLDDHDISWIMMHPFQVYHLRRSQAPHSHSRWRGMVEANALQRLDSCEMDCTDDSVCCGGKDADRMLISHVVWFMMIYAQITWVSLVIITWWSLRLKPELFLFMSHWWVFFACSHIFSRNHHQFLATSPLARMRIVFCPFQDVPEIQIPISELQYYFEVERHYQLYIISLCFYLIVYLFLLSQHLLRAEKTARFFGVLRSSFRTSRSAACRVTLVAVARVFQMEPPVVEIPRSRRWCLAVTKRSGMKTCQKRSQHVPTRNPDHPRPKMKIKTLIDNHRWS